MNYKKHLNHLRTNRRAISIMGVGMGIIGLVIGIVVAANLLPDAVTSLTNATYTGAPAAVKTMMTTVLGIVIAVAVILIFLKVARGRRS